MTYRLLHISDVHLGRTFALAGCPPDVARRRRLGLRDALRAAGDEARARGCAAVTIAGDLYEHERAGVDTERFLVETFASWRPMRVLIAPGNHDPLLPGSVYRRAAWPDNVHVFTEPRPVAFELEDGLTVWGVAHREPSWQGDPLDGAAPPAGGTHLALFHGAELGCRPEGKAVHGPFRAAHIRERGFAAALCGHYHRRRVDALTGLLYPGSPEPLSFDETGPRGPVLVSIEDGNLSYEPLALNRWTATVVACDITDAAGSSEVLDLLGQRCLEALAGGDPGRALVRLDCTGELDPAAAFDVSTVEDALRERCGAAVVRVCDLTGERLDLTAVAEERSARGAFVRAAQAELAAADAAEAAVVRDALRYGLAALAGVEVGLR